MSVRGNIETTANVATVFVAVLLSAILIKVYFLPPTALRRPQGLGEIGVGTSLKDRVPGVDWKGNGRTLVLAISTKCHFCKDSVPFYRKLQEQVGKHLKTVAVLPETLAEAQEYLNAEGVHVDQVREATMAGLGIQGTPTLLLVNSAGVVTKLSIGKIQPEREQEVLAILQKR
jgi:hypothetical protein